MPSSAPISRAYDFANGLVVASGVSSAVTSALTQGCEYLITATKDCWIKIGTGTPVAAANTAGSMFLPAARGLVVRIPLSASPLALAAIQDAAVGNVSVVPTL